MKKIKHHGQKTLILIILLFIIPVTSLVAGIGLSPAEMRVIDAVGSGVIGSIVVVNSEEDPRNFILQIESPSAVPSEEEHLRVICDECHETYQRYEINDGICQVCNSTDLIVYDRIPENVLQYITLKGVDCELKKTDNYYYTKEKFNQNEQCTIDIYLDLPYEEKYSNKHWEAHITATTTSDINNIAMGVMARVQMRLLLDVPSISSSMFTSTGKNTIIIGTTLVIALGICFIIFFIWKRESLKKKSKISLQGKTIKKSKRLSSFYLKNNGKNNDLRIKENKEPCLFVKEPDFSSASRPSYHKSNKNDHFSEISDKIDKILNSHEKE